MRMLLRCFWWVLGLAALAVTLAFVPAVQTWIAQTELGRRWPESGVAFDSLSAGLDGVKITNLRVARDGAVLTLPTVEASLPVKTALWDRKVLIRSLVAKGWTLDLSRPAQAGEASAQPAAEASEPVDMGEKLLDPARTEKAARRVAEQVARGVFAGWKLPGEGSLDGVDLEGDVLIPGTADTQPGRVHVIIKGGGLAAAREASFTTAVSGAVVGPGLSISDVAVQGRLTVSVDDARQVTRVGMQADVTVNARATSREMAWSVDGSVSRSGKEDDYALEAGRDGRRLVSVAGHFDRSKHALEGTWNIDWRKSDVATVAPTLALPAAAVTGKGRFETDPGFQTVQVAGSLRAIAGDRAGFKPWLARLGAPKGDGVFALTQRGAVAHVERLDATVAGDRPLARVQWLQPFELDEKTWRASVADAKRDWMKVSLSSLPLAGLGAGTDRATVAAGDVSGEFLVAAAGGGYRVRQAKPLQATGVAIEGKDGATLVSGLDLSVMLSGDYAGGAWSVQARSGQVEVAGKNVAKIEAKLSQPADAQQPPEFAGTWAVDLGALRAAVRLPGRAWIRGRSAAGDFSGQLGQWPGVKGKLEVTGRDPANRLSGTFQADIGDDDSVNFVVPVKLALGPETSDLSAEGSWAGPDDPHRIDMKLSGESVFLGHLRLLGGPLLAAILGGGAGDPFSLAKLEQRSSTEPDRAPFWRNWAGSLSLNFRKLKTAGQEFSEVGGLVNFDPDSIRLIGGRVALAQHSYATMGGSVAFDPDVAVPYTIKVAGSCKELEAAGLFPKPKEGEYPPLEGRFSITDNVTGTGANLADLIRHAHEEIRLTSDVGIVRLLKTDVAQSMPEEDDSAVKDRLENVGSAIGTFFGVNKRAGGWGNIKVNPTTQAVLDFVNEVAEIGYNRLAVTAEREPGGGLRLTQIEMVAPEEHVTGSGEIATDLGRPWRAQPLQLDLHFAAQGDAAKFLRKAGLLSAKKDALGYNLIDRPFHFGGTLEHLDAAAWHDYLLKAAMEKPAAGKKNG